MGDTVKSANGSWKIRLGVGLAMLVLALISLIIMRIAPSTYWFFCWLMAGIDAILSIGLTWYFRSQFNKSYPSTIWQQILHWIGLFAAMYLLVILVDRSVIGHTDAGLIALIMLALTIYLSGIYTDSIFIFIGIALAIVGAGTMLIKAYLLLVMIPVVVIIAAIISTWVIRDRKKSSASADKETQHELDEDID